MNGLFVIKNVADALLCYEGDLYNIQYVPISFPQRKNFQSFPFNIFILRKNMIVDSLKSFSLFTVYSTYQGDCG